MIQKSVINRLFIRINLRNVMALRFFFFSLQHHKLGHRNLLHKFELNYINFRLCPEQHVQQVD